MTGLWKFLKWGLLAVLVLAVAAVFLIATLDPNDHKDWIAAKVKEETGRDLELKGDVSLTYYPWLGVEVNGLVLSNAPGFGPEPFLAFDHFKARIKLVPLLRKKYEIDTVELYGARLNLARNKDGVTNWADLMKEPAQEKDQPPPLTAIVLGGLDVRDARVTWSDATTGADYRMEEINARTGALTYGEPIDLALTLKAVSNKPDLNGDVKLDGTLAYDLDNEVYRIQPLALKGTIRGPQIPGGSTDLDLGAVIETNLRNETATISDLRLSVLDMLVEGRVEADHIESPNPGVKTTLKATGQDLSLLFRILEVEPLASQLARLEDRSFDLDTTLAADLERGDVSVSPLSVNLLGARIQGDVKATNVRSDTPGVRGTLSAAGPDLAAVLGVLGQFQGGKKSPFTRLASEAEKAPAPGFNIRTDFDADMKTGEVKVPTFQADLLGAKVQARLSGRNMHTDKPHVQGSLEASGADLPLLLRAAAAFQPGQDAPLGVYGRQLGKLPDRAFTVKAEFDANLESGDIDVPQLSLRGLGIEAGGNLKARNMQGSDGEVNGRLTLSGEKMGALLKAVEQPDLAEVLQAVRLEAGISGKRSDLMLKPLEVRATVAGKEVGPKPVDIALKADTRINLDAEQLTLEGLSLTGLDLNVTGNIEAAKFMSAPDVRGQLKVAPFNLRKLMRQLNQKLPDTADKKVLRKVALETRFAGSPTRIELQDLKLDLDASHLQGQFSFRNPEKPVIRFGLAVDEIDLDRYLPPEPEEAKGKGKKPATPETAAAAAATELPVELLRRLDIEGNLEIGSLVFSKAHLKNVKLAISGKEGTIRMDPVTAQLYKGTYNGSVALDARAKVPRLTLNTKLTGVEAEPLLKDMTGKARLRGTGDFSMALVAAGADTETMKKTLNGQMSFVFRDGAIKGFNLGKMLRSAKSFKSEGTLKVAEEEETDFTEMTGNPVVQKGVVRLDDLDAKSPAFRITGKGVLADLPRDRIDYTASATVVATSKGQGGKDLAQLDGITIPIRIKGSIEDPKISPDLGGIAASFATNEVKKKLLDKLGVPQEKPAEGTQQGTEQQLKQDPAKQLLDKALKDIFQ
jgi:AsmA protein